MKKLKHQAIVLSCAITASIPAFGLNTDSNHYYLELSTGNKSITSADLDADARIGKVGAFVHFKELFGIGLTAAKVEYGAEGLAWGKAPNAGTEFGIESRLISPALSIFNSKLSAFVGLGGTVDSKSRRRSVSEPGDASLSLTGRSESAEITELFKSMGPAASIGLKLDFLDEFGLQAEYSAGREKWITKRAVYNGREASYKNLEDQLMTRQLVIGLTLMN
jgi:hypothetical protein